MVLCVREEAAAALNYSVFDLELTNLHSTFYLSVTHIVTYSVIALEMLCKFALGTLLCKDSVMKTCSCCFSSPF